MSTQEGNIDQRIKTILELAQRTTACHQKYAIVLKSIFEIDNHEFISIFTKYMQTIACSEYKDKNIYMDRCVSFIETFCTTLKSKNENGVIIDHPLLHHIITSLVEWSTLDIESLRFWSCKLINHILENREDVSEDLYEMIRNAMLERLLEGKSAILMQAVYTSYRLQDPTDPEDEITREFCEILDTCLNAKVRQVCVEKVALTKYVIPFIFRRIRDININVRLAAFKKMVPLAKHLKIKQKRTVLQCGFLDTTPTITTFISTVLVTEWLKSYDSDYLSFMASLRLDATAEDIKKTVFLVESLLNALFKSKSVDEIVSVIGLNQLKFIEYDNLNWDLALYYRVVIQYFKKIENLEDALNSIQPELIDFCTYIRKYCELMMNKLDVPEYLFILQQFFLITKEYDVGDPTSRQCLNSLVCHVLQNLDLTADVAEVVVNNLDNTIPNVKNRSIFVCEIISNIVYGENAIDYEELRRQETERHQEISQLKDELISLRDKEEECVCEGLFSEAQQVKIEIEKKEELVKNLGVVRMKNDNLEMKTDIPTVVKYLTVAEALLRSPSITQLNPALSTLSSEFILKVLVHESDEVKAKAFKCYALCCIVDKKCASYGIHIFSSPILCSADCDIEILLVCIRAVVDLLLIYGLSLVKENNEIQLSESRRESEKMIYLGGTCLEDVVQGLANLLEHEEPQVQEVATIGVCRLLKCARITSSSLLSRIIVKWANPATDNERLKQHIGHTLNALAALSNCRTYFGDAVIETIRTFTYAPRNSSLLDVDQNRMVNFMLTLCMMSSEGTLIHGDVALRICSHMIDKPRAKINVIFSKTLLLLSLPDNAEILDDLLNICDQLIEAIRQTQILRNITKFKMAVTEAKVKLGENV